jgi:hypothetical protein
MFSVHRTGASTMGDNKHGHPRRHPRGDVTNTPEPASHKRAGEPGAGDGQQGTGGIASGEATSTPSQRGSQPHLGSQPGHAGGAPGGSGENEGGNEDQAGIPGGGDEIDAMARARTR